MRSIIEAIYWIRIFLSPNFLVGLILAIIHSVSGFRYWQLLLFIPSIVIGILLAERARKKYGTSNYVAKTMNTPDLKENTE